MMHLSQHAETQSNNTSPAAVPLHTHNQKHVSEKRAPVTDADEFQTVQKTSRRQPRIAQQAPG